jgi:hypothetical protein
MNEQLKKTKSLLKMQVTSDRRARSGHADKKQRNHFLFDYKKAADEVSVKVEMNSLKLS